MKTGPKPRPLLNRFLDKVSPEPMSGCWLWTAHIRDDGYGDMGTGSLTDGSRRTKQAHVVGYELFKGKIPNGLQLDHLCRNTACCNPDHLEAVTPKINVSRSQSVTSINKRKTHCKWGHEFTVENTYKTTYGGRACRLCVLAYQARHYRARNENVKQHATRSRKR